jgi:hypothetical protein
MGLILRVAALSVVSVLAASVGGRGYPQYSPYAALLVTPATIVL